LQVKLKSNTALLEQMGENIILATKRKKLTAMQLAERAGIARSTL